MLPNMHVLQLCLVLIGLVNLCYGGCPSATLFAFIQNPAISVTISLDGEYHLPVTGSDNSIVLPGGYVPLKCNPGYRLAEGQLNVTCSGDAWSPFPKCVQSSNDSPTGQQDNSAVNDGCCTIDDTTFSIANGYQESSALAYKSEKRATGSIKFGCHTGYSLDPALGSIYSCSNGVWSPKPKCVRTGLCSYSKLENFIYGTPAIQTTGKSRLMKSTGEKDAVLPGSYIILACQAGHRNVGGDLTVTCTETGTWSAFPNCISNDNSGPVASIHVPTSDGEPCLFDRSMLSIVNGYYSSMAVSHKSPDKVTGSIQFVCIPGYSVDPVTGGRYVCNNGVWSTKPQCIKNNRCSFTVLEQYVKNTFGLETTGESRLVQAPDEKGVVLVDSFIVLACMKGYKNVGGDLRVVCKGDGNWSPFPSCAAA